MVERRVSGVWSSEIRRGMELIFDHLDRGCMAMTDEPSGLERRLIGRAVRIEDHPSRWVEKTGLATDLLDAAAALGEMRRAMVDGGNAFLSGDLSRMTRAACEIDRALARLEASDHATPSSLPPAATAGSEAAPQQPGVS